MNQPDPSMSLPWEPATGGNALHRSSRIPDCQQFACSDLKSVVKSVRKKGVCSKYTEMLKFDVPKMISKRERRLAWLVALTADAIQFVALPLFAAGGASPLDSATDIAAAAILCKLLGWHWAFLPAVVAELIPGLNLF